MSGKRDDDDELRHDGMTLPIARALETLAAELRAAQAALDAQSVRASTPIRLMNPSKSQRGLALTLLVTAEEAAARLATAAGEAERIAAAMANDRNHRNTLSLSLVRKKRRRKHGAV